MTTDFLASNVRELCTDTTNNFTDAYIIDCYAKDPDKAIALVYKRYGDMLFYRSKKYHTICEEDVRSYILESINKALATFNFSKQFNTYLTVITINAFNNHLKENNTQKRSLPKGSSIEYFDAEFEKDEMNDKSYANAGSEDYNISDIEFISSVAVLSLEDIEFRYMQLLLDSTRIPTDSDIARYLDIPRYTVKTVRKHVGEKLLQAINK